MASNHRNDDCHVVSPHLAPVTGDEFPTLAPPNPLQDELFATDLNTMMTVAGAGDAAMLVIQDTTNVVDAFKSLHEANVSSAPIVGVDGVMYDVLDWSDYVLYITIVCRAHLSKLDPTDHSNNVLIRTMLEDRWTQDTIADLLSDMKIHRPCASLTTRIVWHAEHIRQLWLPFMTGVHRVFVTNEAKTELLGVISQSNVLSFMHKICTEKFHANDAHEDFEAFKTQTLRDMSFETVQCLLHKKRVDRVVRTEAERSQAFRDASHLSRMQLQQTVASVTDDSVMDPAHDDAELHDDGDEKAKVVAAKSTATLIDVAKLMSLNHLVEVLIVDDQGAIMAAFNAREFKRLKDWNTSFMALFKPAIEFLREKNPSACVVPVCTLEEPVCNIISRMARGDRSRDGTPEDVNAYKDAVKPRSLASMWLVNKDSKPIGCLSQTDLIGLLLGA